MYRYLLFDLDRTLWDFDGNAAVTFRKMYEHFALESILHTDYETFRSLYRTINEALWDAYRKGTITKEYLHVKRFSLTLEHFHTPPELTGRLAREMGDFYIAEGPKQKGLMPGCMDLLEHLKAKGCYHMSIITNGFGEAQMPKLRTSGLLPYFEHIFLSESIGINKPDHRFFEWVMESIKATKEDCLVIGDDYEVDILGAHNCGIDQIYYNPNGKRPNADVPTYEVAHLGDIKAIL